MTLTVPSTTPATTPGGAGRQALDSAVFQLGQAAERGLTLRQAAHVIAAGRVAEAHRARHP
jgi:hypothetical protein